jgi:ATP-dependent Clp protease ATP-binding subunit ClpC
MSEKFTQGTHKVIRLARKEARSFNHSHLGSEHLLLGLTGESASVAASVLRRLGTEFDEVREEVESVVGYGMEGMGDRATFTPRAKRVLEAALQESLRQGHNYIRTDHLLLGLLRESGGVAARVLLNLGVDPDESLRETRKILRTRDIDEDDPLDQVPWIE